MKGKPTFRPSESQIERAICDFLRIRLPKETLFWKQPNRGYLHGKMIPGTSLMMGRFRKDLNPYTRQGVPDIILIHRGIFIGLEVKTDRNKLTSAQEEFRRDVLKADGYYFMVRSVDEVELLLRELKIL